jgi:outer membrane protein assembly complex protein YaeT
MGVAFRWSFAVIVAASPFVAGAQIPYHAFDDKTEVSKISFTFITTQSFKESRLGEEMALRERTRVDGLRKLLSSFLPLSKPQPHPFSPIELQRDVARLRRFYSTAGFLGTKISYDVTYINDRNQVNIELLIDEGKPMLLQGVSIDLPGGGNPADSVPAELKSEWNALAAHKDTAIGKRFTAAESARISGEVLGWWMRRGWAFAEATTDTIADSVAATVNLAIHVDPGPRARVDSIDVEGNRSVSRGLVLRTVPVATGDWFSSTKLSEGQRRLFGLSLFRLALADVPDSQPRDSTVLVRIRLRESQPRLVTGEAGYVSAGGGITARAEFAHRNFTGGARSLRVNGVAQTGLAASGRPDRRYELSVSFNEPLLFHRQLSGSIAPFAGYRNNSTDRSNEFGVQTTLVYDANQYRFFTLQHRYSNRRVLDYRIGSGSSIDLESLLRLQAEGALDSIGPEIQRSVLALSASIGRADPTTSNRRVVLWQPSVEVTTPAPLNTIEFLHAELPVSAYFPLGNRVSLMTRARFGRVYPYGKTVTGDSIGPVESIRLREVLLNTGGTGSVRGWENGLLGPKLLNLQFIANETGDTITLSGTDGYIPAGGLARAFLSAELRLPFPFMFNPSWGTHVFVDAGRVWSSDKRFMREDPNDEQRWFYSAGAGVDVRTIIGPIKASIGYKLNPSVLDVRNANAVLDALQNGRPVESVSANWKRRLHFHISIGQTF